MLRLDPVTDPVTVTKLGISVVVGLFAAAAAFFFTQQGILKVRDSDILYVKKGPVAPGIVRLSRTPGQGFSFFINVYITPKQGRHGSFTVLADRLDKLSFLIRSDGIPGFRWESKKRLPLPSPKVHQGLPGNRKVTWDRWTHVGFVYEGGKLTTFVNGRKCRETSIGWMRSNVAADVYRYSLLASTLRRYLSIHFQRIVFFIFLTDYCGARHPPGAAHCNG